MLNLPLEIAFTGSSLKFLSMYVFSPCFKPSHIFGDKNCNVCSGFSGQSTNKMYEKNGKRMRSFVAETVS